MGLKQALTGLFVVGFLGLGFVFGMLAADWSMDTLDFYPECIFENWFDYVNGDFSNALNGASWAGLIFSVIFLYPALIIGNKSSPWNVIFWVMWCIFIIIYLCWVVILVYVWLFFSYVYFEETRLVQTCGGLESIRNIWWICLAALGMLIPASISSCFYCCWK